MEQSVIAEEVVPSTTSPATSLPSTIIQSGEHTERTPLLPPHPAGKEDGKDVHYRNVDGTRFWFLFGTLIFGSTIAFFDTTLTFSSHPAITSYFDSSNSASWLSTAFYLTSTVSQPLYGRVSDTVGRRPVYLFASTVFFLSTAWCALAQSIGSFIAARAFCGLGAGGVMIMSNIIIADIIKIEYRGIYRELSPLIFITKSHWGHRIILQHRIWHWKWVGSRIGRIVGRQTGLAMGFWV